MKMKLVLVCLLNLYCFQLFAQGIVFETGTWEQVKAKAKKERKFIFVDLHTEWCGPCKLLEKAVFPLDSVGAFMNSKFVSLRYDAEKGYGVVMAKKFMPASYPTFLVFDEEANLINTGGGGGDNAAFFLDQVKAMITPPKSAVFTGVSTDMNLSYPDFYHAYFEKRKQPDPKVVLNYLKNEKDWLTEVNWSVINTFSRFIPEYKTWSVKHAEELHRLYGLVIDTDPLNPILEHLNTAVESRDIKGFEQAISAMELIDHKDRNPGLSDRIRFNKLRFYAQTHQKEKFKKQVTADEVQVGDQYKYLAIRLLSQESRDTAMLNYALEILPKIKSKELLEQEIFIRYLLNQYAQADVLVSEIHEDTSLLQNLSVALAARATENLDFELFTKAIEILNTYPFPGKDRVISQSQIAYYTQARKWKEMSQAVNSLLADASQGVDDRQISSYAFYIMKSSEDTSVIRSAIAWIRPLATGSSEIRYVYTLLYAQLFFKIKDDVQAKYWAEQTLSLSENNPDSLDEAKKLIAQISHRKKS